MNITLFGGAFNPPHLGHLIVVQQAFELITDMDELWILPCYRHTFQKHLAPTKHRLEMTKLLLKEFATRRSALKKSIKIDTTEIDYKLSGETYEATKIFKRKYPQYTFSFLMGTDNLKDFKKWGNWQKLLKEMHFYVYPRAGYQNSIKFPNMTLLKSETQVVTNISSTLIRRRIQISQPITHLIQESILDYLRSNNLYNDL
jgi:nicotinate-nucleotide adenylyltransferase